MVTLLPPEIKQKTALAGRMSCHTGWPAEAPQLKGRRTVPAAQCSRNLFPWTKSIRVNQGSLEIFVAAAVVAAALRTRLALDVVGHIGKRRAGVDGRRRRLQVEVVIDIVDKDQTGIQA